MIYLILISVLLQNRKLIMFCCAVKTISKAVDWTFFSTLWYQTNKNQLENSFHLGNSLKQITKYSTFLFATSPNQNYLLVQQEMALLQSPDQNSWKEVAMKWASLVQSHKEWIFIEDEISFVFWENSVWNRKPKSHN